jgi:hypothetical protein
MMGLPLFAAARDAEECAREKRKRQTHRRAFANPLLKGF